MPIRLSESKYSIGLGNVENTLNRLIGITPPTINDDFTQGYTIGSIWANNLTNRIYTCTDSTPGAAIWQLATTIDSDDVLEGVARLYYTEARVDANTNVSANTTHRGLTTNPHTVTKTQVLTGDLIVDSDVDASAAIAYNKLSLTGSILNTDINVSAGITESKLSLDFGTSGLNTAITTHSGLTNNPHTVTPAQVGNTSAQWNANLLQSRAMATTLPSDGQSLIWNISNNQWQPGNPTAASAVPTTQLTSILPDATSSLTFQIIPGITVTPVAGTYVVLFTVDGSLDNKAHTGQIELFMASNPILHTHRSFNVGANNNSNSLSTQMYITVNGAQQIDARFATTGGIFTTTDKSMILMKVG